MESSFHNACRFSLGNNGVQSGAKAEDVDRLRIEDYGTWGAGQQRLLLPSPDNHNMMASLLGLLFRRVPKRWHVMLCSGKRRQTANGNLCWSCIRSISRHDRCLKILWASAGSSEPL